MKHGTLSFAGAIISTKRRGGMMMMAGAGARDTQQRQRYARPRTQQKHIMISSVSRLPLNTSTPAPQKVLIDVCSTVEFIQPSRHIIRIRFFHHHPGPKQPRERDEKKRRMRDRGLTHVTICLVLHAFL